ncbi:pancreatic adenocarcinoma up-regulated factor [Pan paniscus]|uniref:Zymogen granule protein 16B n=1 Tax=Pan paniscus TaxID=9597 RepID=A0A2R9AXU7_PANPA|nr:zymogen granule protein 16 homolog B [Pan paniscus]
MGAQGAQESIKVMWRVPGTTRRPVTGESPGMHQPEAMLLLLTLALLGGPTWAGKMYGPGGGKYFSTTEDYDHEITGLRVSVGLLLVKSVQVKLGDSWDVKLGALGGNTQEVTLQPGEYITKVFVAFQAFLRGMLMYTSKDRYFYFGKLDGQISSAYPSQEGQVLVGIYGQYQLLGIKSIGFEWNYPLEELTTEPPVNLTYSTNSPVGR